MVNIFLSEKILMVKFSIFFSLDSNLLDLYNLRVLSHSVSRGARG